jgi:TMEM175 potassium channel family protein
MPAHQDTPRERRSLSTDRMKAFSDGVFSIAATLLVLDLAVHPPGTPLQQVLHAWPGYVAYVVSFLTIGGAWLLHTALTERLTRADPVFLQINLVLLLVVAFLPFPTRLVADALHDVEAERVAVTVYGLTLLAIRLLGSALDAYARREHLYSQPDDGEEAYERRSLLPVVIGYVTAILVGLALPKVAVALYFGIAVFLVVPFGEVRRLLFRRS